MFITISILVFGLLYAFRIYQINERNRVFDNQTLKNSLLIIIFLTLWCCWLFKERFFLIWIIVLVAILLLEVTIFVTARFRERKFRQDFVDFLDRVILHVRSGQSFQNSLEVSNAKTPQLSSLKLEKIIEAINFSEKIESQNAFVREIFREMNSIQLFPHKTLNRLCAFRRKIKIEDDFRRRSSRIVGQVRIQVIFLLCLYVALLCFVTSRFGFFENVKIILWSVSLFVAGIGGFLYLGVKKQWKI